MLLYLCIKSRADALANLPVPGQGGFRESGDVAAPATKRGRHSSALLGANRWRVFTCQRTSFVCCLTKSERSLSATWPDRSIPRPSSSCSTQWRYQPTQCRIASRRYHPYEEDVRPSLGRASPEGTLRAAS